MTDAPVPAVAKIRYVAGFSPTVPPTADVVLLAEDAEGNRIGQRFVLSDLTAEQVRGLRDQLSTVLILLDPEEAEAERRMAEVERASVDLFNERRDRG